TNNLVRKELYGIKDSTTGEDQGTAALTAAAPGFTFLKNAIAGSSSSTNPANNFYPTVAAWEAAFTHYTVTGVNANFTILPTSNLSHAGTDGKDIGADIDLVMRATSAVESAISTIGTGKIRMKKRSGAIGARSVLTPAQFTYVGAI